MLEARPMAVVADLSRRVVQIEVDVAGTLGFDPALERRIGRLVGAGVVVAVACPAPFLPVRNLAAFDGFCGAAPPHHAREKLADGGGGRPGTEVSYAHTRMPTSALVEAKIFSPSLTLSK